MLFWKELKKIVIGVPYFLFVVVAVFALYSQGALDFSKDKITKPEPNKDYGTKNEEIPEVIMPAALQSLFAEFKENNYKTYPIGFFKNVKLDKDEQRKIAEIISKITGNDINEIYSLQNFSESDGDISFDMEINTDIQSNKNGDFVISADKGEDKESLRGRTISLSVRDNISYSEFKELMQRADNILGGGSEYAAEALISYGSVPVSYEEALQRYQLAKNNDKITRGYARLFSDYAAVMVSSILPVFIAVIMSMKDKSAKMSELIYIRKESGIRIVSVRFIAIITAVMIPLIILSYISNISVWNMYQGIKLDYLAPLKYDFGWILPSAMIVTAIGMCLTELTNTPIAIAICGLWWFVDINLGIKSVAASCSLFRLSPRHNAAGNSYFRTQDFIDNFPRLFNNRLFFIGLSILFVIVTVIIYEAKRKGKLNGDNKIKRAFASIRHSKGEFKA